MRRTLTCLLLAALVGLALAQSVTLDWDDNLEADLSHYIVYRGVETGVLWPMSVYVPSIAEILTSTYVDTSVQTDSTYFYAVTAVDDSDNESSQSSEISVTLDFTAPDTSSFAAVVFDTTNASNVRLDLAAVADEAALASWQWREAYDGTWTPTSDQWVATDDHSDTTFATSLSDTIYTTLATSAMDSAQVRFRLKDDNQNVSPWYGPFDNAFVREEPVVAEPDSGFITVWSIDTSGDQAARTITLPLSSGNSSTFDAVVDWGDGGATSAITAVDDPDRIHEYAYDAGGGATEFTVTITGTLEGWSFNNSGSALDIVRVEHWGDSAVFDGFKYLERGFYGCSNLTKLGTGPIGASGDGVTSFYYTFRDNNLTSLPSGLFDNHLSVTSFYYTFGGNSLTSLPSGLFDNNTSVTSFYWTFAFNNLASIPPGLFYNNTSVTDFSRTFFANNELVLSAGDVYPVADAATHFLDRNVNFTSMFERSSYSGTSQGTAPVLWTGISWGTGGPTGTNCFAGAGNNTSSISNYGDIPPEWGGE